MDSRGGQHEPARVPGFRVFSSLFLGKSMVFLPLLFLTLGPGGDRQGCTEAGPWPHHVLLSGSDHGTEEGEAMAGPPRGLGRVASGKKLPVSMM